jgi:folate-binding protein YgfZ
MAGTAASLLADEHRILLEACGAVDRSERGKLALDGPDAVEFLNGQVTNELATLRPGDGRYAAFLTHKGKMLGDLRVLATGEDPGGPPTALLLDTERVALQDLFDMIRRFKVGFQVELHKRTVECALVSLIGPRAGEVAGVAEAADQLPVAEHSHIELGLAGVPVRAVRTDVGVDLMFAAEQREPVDAELRRRGAPLVSEEAAECLRIERGRPRYGIDLDSTVIPQEAGLNDRAVSFTKGCYVGQETVARLYYRGKPNRHLRGLRLGEPAETGAELRLGERPVGHLGSVTVSPRLGPIALALVRREAAPGSEVSVGTDGLPGEVVELPFAV